MMRAEDIHAQLSGGRWRDVLVRVGIGEQFLRKKGGPCPVCGGRDRFSYDDRHGKGDYRCRGCGSGDGFSLVMKHIHGDFVEARRAVIDAAGLERTPARNWAPPAKASPQAPVVAQPSRRVLDLLRTSCRLEDCQDAVDYLASRQIAVSGPAFALRAHAGAEYFHEGQRVGKFPAILAPVVDATGALVTLHVTYLENGRKVSDHEPRKILSPLTGHEACAVRLMPVAGAEMGIGEGIETCLAAAAINGIPTWSALNAGLLAKFTPPEGVERLVIFADADVPGLLAAAKLMERLQGRVHVKICAPPNACKDWNEVAITAASQRESCSDASPRNQSGAENAANGRADSEDAARIPQNVPQGGLP